LMMLPEDFSHAPLRLSLNSAKAKDETKMNKDKISINNFFIKLIYPIRIK